MKANSFLDRYMSRKNQHIKKIAIVVFILLVLASSNLFPENSLNNSEAPSPVTKREILSLPTKTVRYESVILPITDKSKTANNISVKAQTLANFPLKEVFECNTTIDEDLIEQIRQTLALYSYEMPLKTKKHQVNELLAIRVISSDLPINFDKTINEKVKLILLLYKKWFGLTLQEPITMNLVLLPSLESYSDVISTLSIDSTNSQGLFLTNSNFAFAAYRTEQQLEHTIIHELVHAINFYLFGHSARWLTEGLADYFKKIEFHMEGNVYMYSFNHSKTLNSPAPLKIDDLAFLENEWDSAQRSHLYASAFQFVSYLIKHREEKNILRQLLHKEARHPCTKLDSNTYLNLITEGFLDLSSDFQ